jgi:putative ABC transport system ATP-binding protein
MEDEIIKYENASISFGSKKMLSNFSLCIPKGKRF